MAGHECYHCKQWIEEGEAHDCWTTTEAALTRELPEDLSDAWERLRDTAAEFGEQRIYASHNSIMFSRKSCYFYVRPKKSFLEVCVFLGRAVKSPHVRRSEPSSKTKFLNIIQLKHRDQVEAPITDWLREAYDFSVTPGQAKAGSHVSKKKPVRSATKKRVRAAAKKKVAKKTKVSSRSASSRSRPRR